MTTWLAVAHDKDGGRLRFAVTTAVPTELVRQVWAVPSHEPVTGTDYPITPAHADLLRPHLATPLDVDAHTWRLTDDAGRGCRWVVEAFDLVTEHLAFGVRTDLTAALIREVWSLDPWDPAFGACYPVTAENVDRVQAAVPVRIDLGAYDWQISADVGDDLHGHRWRS